MKREEYLQAIEAILFVSGKPVKIDDLKNTLSIDSDSLQELLLDLENNLKEKGINIATKKNGYILIPNEKYRRFFERFIKKRRQKFTKDALEVIAILYKERKPKETIDKLRGVNSARMLNQLVKKGMAKKEFIEGKVFYSLSENLVNNFSIEIQKAKEEKDLFENRHN
jgi:segregation and condensation protein B